jgi:hypothetical protein
MGAVVSSITEVVTGIKAAFKIIKGLNADYQSLLSRINTPPGLPVSFPTPSYWLEDPPFAHLVDAQSTALPPSADIVIIGSGITAAAIARTILAETSRKDQPIKITVLEARQLCSGATGRNGGHIKLSPHESFERYRRAMSSERAAANVRFQLRHLDCLLEMCREEGIVGAECRTVDTVDLFLDEGSRERAFRQVRELRAWVPEVEIRMWTGEEAQKVSKVVL